MRNGTTPKRLSQRLPHLFLFTFLMISILLTAPLDASQRILEDFADRRLMSAYRLGPGEAIDLDGVLDETLWERPEPASDFIQVDPDNGAPATERTEVRIVYSENALYMGVICYDSSPEGMMGNTMLRDAALSSGDRFMWVFDTYLDERSGYFFEINPSGSMGDSLVFPAGEQQRAWDGIWTARIRRTEIGWIAEIEIPFRTLNFNPDGAAWGINFQRTVRRKNEESIWNGFARNQDLRTMSNAGLLTNVSEVDQGIGLDVKPYVVGSGLYDSRRPDPNNQALYTGDTGVDFVYAVTPNLRASFTLNTDFAETEVDDRQVNLTRFPIRFPEKREFFLEGSNYFDLATPFQAFFSRRIGLNQGVPQRIEYGAKLTGQIGAHDIGAMQVRTAEEGGRLGEDFTILRGTQRFWSESMIGMLYTRRAARASDTIGALGGSGIPDPRHTIAFDYNLTTRTFLGDKNLRFRGDMVYTSNPAGTGKSSRGSFGITYPNDLINASLRGNLREANFDPAVGFNDRRGIKEVVTGLTIAPRPDDHPVIRQYSFGVNVNRITSSSNTLLSRRVRFSPLSVGTHAGDGVQFEIFREYERLERDFRQPQGDIVLPQGSEYRFTRFEVSWITSNQRVVAIAGNYSWGDYFSGTRREFEPRLEIRPQVGLVIDLSGEFNRVELAEGSFSTSLLQSQINKQFSPWISLASNLQYDTLSRIIGWQARFRWIMKPGNDIYFVYTQNWRDDPGDIAREARIETIDRKAASKIIYTHRF